MDEELKKEMDELLGAEVPSEEVPAEEVLVEEAPAEEETPGEETPNEEETPAEETPVVEEKPSEEETPSEEKPSEEEKPLSDAETIEALRQQVNELMARQKPPVEEKPPEEKPLVETKPEEKPSEEKPKPEDPFAKDIDYVGDAKLDDLFDSKEGFNSFLNNFRRSVAAESINMGARLGVEQVLRHLPEVVRANVQRTVTFETARRKFYEENVDLVPFANVVAESFEQVSSQNPDKSLEDLLKETGSVTRKRLGLQAQASGASREEKPRFERGPRGARPAKGGNPKVDQLAGEIDEITKGMV